MDETVSFDEKTLMIEALKGFKGIGKFFKAFDNIKIGDAEALDKLEHALKAIPPGETIIKALEENIANAKTFLNEAKNIRIHTFKQHETEYIKQLQSDGKQIREYDGGWRIGKIKMEVKPELARIRVLYNNEVIINWKPISSKDDFIAMEEKGLSLLESQRLNENDVINVFYEAYKQASARRANNVKTALILDFYRETRIALIRKNLDTKPLHAKIDKYLDFTKWAFLYNLDIYRAMGSNVPEDKRLGLQTGSMQEVSKEKKGMVVNGLNPNDEYKVMCYVISAKGSCR